MSCDMVKKNNLEELVLSHAWSVAVFVFNTILIMISINLNIREARGCGQKQFASRYSFPDTLNDYSYELISFLKTMIAIPMT